MFIRLSGIHSLNKSDFKLQGNCLMFVLRSVHKYHDFHT